MNPTCSDIRSILRAYESQIRSADEIDDAFLRKAWVVSGLWEWTRVIRDRDRGHDADAEEIAAYFRMCGWQWFLDAYGDGMYVETYEVDGEVRFMEWCGVFHGATGSTIGAVFDVLGHGELSTASLKSGVRKYVMPGTPRLASSRKWSEAGTEPFLDLSRDEADVGDIVVVGRRSYGSHITQVVDTGRTWLLTLEGNATGVLGDGSVGEGVIVRYRDRAEVKRAYRPMWTQFVGGLR